MTQITKNSISDHIINPGVDCYAYTFQFETNGTNDLVRELEPIELKDCKTNYYYNGYNIALIGQEGVDAIKYFDKAIANNTIGDKDKVYFTKSSLFPRASFNRYSDKARLVQTTKAATKYAVPTNIMGKIDFSPYDVIQFKSPALAKPIIVHAITRYTYNILSQANKTSLSGAERKILQNCNRNRWNITPDANWYPSMAKAIEEVHNMPPQEWEVEKLHLRVLKGRTKKEEDTIPFLLSGEIEIEDFVNDNEVNRYIDTFKGEFDDSMYEYLFSTLSVKTSDPEVPMQLLCNMKIDAGNPRLDALFINLPKDAKANITSNRVMNTVDVKNFMDNNKLTHLLDYYSTENLEARLRALSDGVAKYNNPEDRKKLFDLTKDGLEELINQQLGTATYKIKVNYEEFTEPDGTEL